MSVVWSGLLLRGCARALRRVRPAQPPVTLDLRTMMMLVALVQALLLVVRPERLSALVMVRVPVPPVLFMQTTCAPSQLQSLVAVVAALKFRPLSAVVMCFVRFLMFVLPSILIALEQLALVSALVEELEEELVVPAALLVSPAVALVFVMFCATLLLLPLQGERFRPMWATTPC